MYARFPDTHFRDNRNTDMSKFDYDRYKDILEYIDSYALGLELQGKQYHYHLYSDSPYNYIYYATITSWSAETITKKNTGFMVTFYQNCTGEIMCKINISIRKDLDGFNVHKVAGQLRNKIKRWRKDRENQIHVYTIPFKSVQELEDICGVFSPYLP